MSDKPYAHLSRRERQIMDILYREGRASVARVRAQMPDAPSYSAVRAQLRVLEEKGYVRHEAQDLRYVYVPCVPQHQAKRSAITHLLRTFFAGSAGEAVAELLSYEKLSKTELDRLARLVKEARKEERR